MAELKRKGINKTKSRNWGLSSTYSSSTLHEVAYMLDITRERVRQIEANALIKIRVLLKEKCIKARDLL